MSLSSHIGSSTRVRRIGLAAGVCMLALGMALSRWIEPGVAVETTVIADAPALVFRPSAPGKHPVALLAHGVTASKETLFVFGEALAASGFTSVAIDLPGHGASTRSYLDGANASTIEGVARALGGVDAFVGHSMGAYAGADVVRGGHLRPRLFVAMGALPALGANAPPLLLLVGRFEEAVPSALLQPRGTPVVVSGWSDHALEPYDPVLVEAGVAAAGRAVGITPAPQGTRWRWRLLGLGVALAGACVVAAFLPATGRARGPLASIIVIAALAVAGAPWLGAWPGPKRVPVQLLAMAATAVVVYGTGRLRIPRGVFAALMAAGAAFCLIGGASFLALFAFLFGLVLTAGTLIGHLAERGGTHLDGDLAFATLVGYAIGQWLPVLY